MKPTPEDRGLYWIPNAEAEFPHSAFETLNSGGYLKKSVPETYGGNGWGPGRKTPQLLRLLTEIGRLDLSVGRLYEGHVNALHLIDLYGDSAQKQRYFKEAVDGKRFGIWNTDDPKDPVELSRGGSRNILSGTKGFCSGGLHIQRPIITAKTETGPQMVIIHSEALDGSREDSSSWRPLGMKASYSVTVDFSRYGAKGFQLLGTPGDYGTQPHFGTGAVRFAAVQLGGAEALFQCALDHLKVHKRDGDPHQRARMGNMAIQLESGRNWLRETGRIMDAGNYRDRDKVNHANMTRSAMSDICNRIIHLSEKCVGLAGMMEDHPMQRIYRDLNTYLKQPGPDHALASVGEWTGISNNISQIYY